MAIAHPPPVTARWILSATPNNVQNNLLIVSEGSGGTPGGTPGQCNIQYIDGLAVKSTLTIDYRGNVGIGTTTPSYALHLAAGPLRIEGGNDAADTTSYFSFGGYGSFGIDAPGVPNGRFVVENSGNVGIGTNAPSSTLHVVGSFGIDAPGVPNGRFVVENSGNVGIGTNAPSSALHVVGDITVTGDVFLPGADCTEHFDVSGTKIPEPGTVVVIDVVGAPRESREPYDKKVAGVVSGAGEFKAGLVLDKRSSEELRVAVALIGKVYCKVDANYGPIELGDLLTTSPTPGHAMKATDAQKGFGAVLGKALNSLADGTGLIPVLVALQ